MSKTIKSRIDELRSELERHNRLYHVEAAPEISDLDYDRLLKELERLEAEHPEYDSPDSPSHKVGGEPIDGFQTVPHRLPMLSIDNVYEEQALYEFDERVRKLLEADAVEYTVEYKIDGVALALVYEDGRLTQALTRGDGRQGDDVTNNARTVGGVPLRLAGSAVPPLLEVRGEAYIANSDFARLRAEQEARGEQVFANPRNTTAGALKLLDPKLCAARKLRFLAHGIGAAEGTTFASHVEYLAALRSLGLPVTPDVEARTDMESTVERVRELMDGLHALDVEVDGLVVKVNDLATRETLGNTSKSPRWLIAYKWEKYEAVTKVEEITIQVGKTGAITPVAQLVSSRRLLVRRSSQCKRSTTLMKSKRKISESVTSSLLRRSGKIIPHVLVSRNIGAA